MFPQFLTTRKIAFVVVLVHYGGKEREQIAEYAAPIERSPQ
jgi:hypothetical protein